MVACTSPASAKEYFHLARPGGYILHVMNVVNLSLIQSKLFEKAGCNIDFTDEERIFSALHHDLGKLGYKPMGEYYIPQDEDWKTRKGEVYKLNPNLQYMDVTDRGLFILQEHQIPMTWKEYLGIKLADGLFNEASEKYWKSYDPQFALKTNLPRIIHHADYLATRSEYDSWKFTPIETDMDK